MRASAVRAGRDESVRSLVWACGLTERELAFATKGYSLRTYAQGAHICHVGDRFDYWAGVITGLIKLSVVSWNGKPHTVTGISAGGWFGEGSILKDEPRQYDVIAIRDTSLGLLDKVTFLGLYETSFAFNRFLIGQLNERLGQFVGAVQHERLLGPAARIARALYWLVNPALYPKATNCVEISQEELGHLAGLPRQGVNRCLSLLEEEGVIVRQREAIVINDLAALAAYE
jgi:CRP/FNR family transcriptional regulator, cyclic AMP receptor protein